MDLHRLKTYIAERVKESERLSNAYVPDAITRLHIHSAAVGRSILAEIQEAEQAAKGAK